MIENQHIYINRAFFITKGRKMISTYTLQITNFYIKINHTLKIRRRLDKIRHFSRKNNAIRIYDIYNASYTRHANIENQELKNAHFLNNTVNLSNFSFWNTDCCITHKQ